MTDSDTHGDDTGNRSVDNRSVDNRTVDNGGVEAALAELRAQVHAKDCEIERLHADLREAQMTGIAVGVLLARTPGWTEQDAWTAWDRACTRLTRAGNTKALASYIVQTGKLPGEGVTARA